MKYLKTCDYVQIIWIRSAELISYNCNYISNAIQEVLACQYVRVYMYLPTPPYEQDVTQGQF